MNIKAMIKMLKRRSKGPLTIAKEDGMIVGKGVTVMGGADFGSEPYLITLGDNVRISFDVRFVTHDGGTWAFRNYYEDMQDVVKFGPIVVEGGHLSAQGAQLCLVCVLGAMLSSVPVAL